METTAKPRLEKGKEYTVELYPRDEQVKAIYIGEGLGKQIFKNINGSAVWYTFLDNDWITENNKVITHLSISSFGVERAERGELKQISKLIETLNSLGELENG